MSKKMAKRKNRRSIKRQQNKLIILIAAGVLLVVAGIVITKNSLSNKGDPSTVKVSGQPSLKVDKEMIDFGDVKLKTNLTFAFRLTNVGDQPLKISETPYIEVREGC